MNSLRNWLPLVPGTLLGRVHNGAVACVKGPSPYASAAEPHIIPHPSTNWPVVPKLAHHKDKSETNVNRSYPREMGGRALSIDIEPLPGGPKCCGWCAAKSPKQRRLAVPWSDIMQSGWKASPRQTIIAEVVFVFTVVV